MADTANMTSELSIIYDRLIAADGLTGMSKDKSKDPGFISGSLSTEDQNQALSLINSYSRKFDV